MRRRAVPLSLLGLIFIAAFGILWLSNSLRGQTYQTSAGGCCGLASPSFAQIAPAHPERLLKRRVKGFRLRAPSLVDALIKLGQEAAQPLGIEYIDAEAVQTPVSADVPDSTFEEALRAVLGNRRGYAWRVEDGVVVITHRGVPKGRANLFNRVLPAFSIPSCTPQEASHQLWMALEISLHPDISGIAGDYSPGMNAKAIPALHMKDVTVREVLNRIASSAGQLAWITLVSPGEMGQLPSGGLWDVVNYNDPSVMGHVGQLLRHTIHPVGLDAATAESERKP